MQGLAESCTPWLSRKDGRDFSRQPQDLWEGKMTDIGRMALAFPSANEEGLRNDGSRGRCEEEHGARGPFDWNASVAGSVQGQAGRQSTSDLGPVLGGIWSGWTTDRRKRWRGAGTPQRPVRGWLSKRAQCRCQKINGGDTDPRAEKETGTRN
jgi:hypothetical protein